MLRAILLACALACAGSPAMAQMGPWNVFAQPSQFAKNAKKSSGIPPRNARCGWYMGKLTGHRDRSLWLAQNWARRFPKTSARPGAVVVWTRGGNSGHVAKIVSMQGRCRAVVHDNAGTYSRDICRRVIAYVQP